MFDTGLFIGLGIGMTFFVLLLIVRRKRAAVRAYSQGYGEGYEAAKRELKAAAEKKSGAEPTLPTLIV